MSFSLLETMRLQDGHVVRLDRHIARMAASAAWFGYRWNEAAVREAVVRVVSAHPRGSWRLRLLVPAGGSPAVECTPYGADPRAWRVRFASTPVDAEDPFIRNKTTRRETYDAARREHPDVDDVLLWNGREEVTESTIANVVVEVDGARYTPPAACGLLPGVFRAELLDRGVVRERVLTKEAVALAPRLWLINSVREWVDAVLV